MNLFITTFICGRSLLDATIRSSLRREVASLGYTCKLLTRRNPLVKNLGLHQLYRFDIVLNTEYTGIGILNVFLKFGFYPTSYILEHKYLVSDLALLKKQPSCSSVLFAGSFFLLFAILRMLSMQIFFSTRTINKFL